jgi:hypothetical protein
MLLTCQEACTRPGSGTECPNTSTAVSHMNAASTPTRASSTVPSVGGPVVLTNFSLLVSKPYAADGEKLPPIVLTPPLFSAVIFARNASG